MKFPMLAAAFALTSVAFAADVNVVDEIVAKVNGDIVTRSELERNARTIQQELQRQQVAGQRLQQALQEQNKNSLRERIDQLLLVQRAKELNVNVDSELTKYLGDLQRRAKIADPEKFQQYVHEQAGMPYEDFKNQAREGMMTRNVIGREVSSKINIPKADIQKYYDEHKKDFIREERVFLSEVLISTEGKDAAGIAAAEKKAKDISTRAKNGEKFPELARDNSDAATANQGGDLGGFLKENLKKELSDQVWNQPKGFVAAPIKTENGFLILKVDDHQRAGQAELGEVEGEITEALYGPRMQPKVREYLTGLREKAFLEIKPGYLDTGAAPGKDTAWKDPAVLKPETVTKAEVASKTRKKRFFGVVPIPGTTTTVTSKSTSR